MDDDRIYVAVNNSGLKSWTLADGTQTTRGAWAALDKTTGEILWQTETPDSTNIPGYGSAPGAVTVANGVAYACSFAGTRVAMDASTGQVLWNDPPTGELCAAGAAVSHGNVYWASATGRFCFSRWTTAR